jgi:hypothetical protein
VSTTPVANLPPLSTTPAANFATSTANTGAKLPLVSTKPVAKKWKQYQTADTLKEKSIYMLTLLQGVQKIIKTFLIEVFSICCRCQLHRWCTFSCEYLRKFSKKFETGQVVFSEAWAKLIHLKKPEV